MTIQWVFYFRGVLHRHNLMGSIIKKPPSAKREMGTDPIHTGCIPLQLAFPIYWAPVFQDWNDSNAGYDDVSFTGKPVVKIRVIQASLGITSIGKMIFSGFTWFHLFSPRKWQGRPARTCPSSGLFKKGPLRRGRETKSPWNIAQIAVPVLRSLDVHVEFAPMWGPRS